MRDYWLCRAIRICGSQRELARRMRVTREKINFLLNRAKYIKLEDALLVEDATGGEVRFSNLIESLNPKIRKKVEEIFKDNAKSKASDRVIAAMAFENELCGSWGYTHNNLGEIILLQCPFILFTIAFLSFYLIK